MIIYVAIQDHIRCAAGLVTSSKGQHPYSTYQKILTDAPAYQVFIPAIEMEFAFDQFPWPTVDQK